MDDSIFSGLNDGSLMAYNKKMERLRDTEFARIRDMVYLDHTGTTLYAASQIKRFQEDLLSNVYGNPHSGNASSSLSSDVIDRARYRVLQFFKASPDTYSLVFTSGATAALKLVADSFDFKPGLATRDHNRPGCPEALPTENGSTEALPREESCSKILSKETGCLEIQLKDSSEVSLRMTEPCSPSHSATHRQCSADAMALSDRDSCVHLSKHMTYVESLKNQEQRGMFVYLDDSHTSVVGMREVFCARGAQFSCLTPQQVEDSLSKYTPHMLGKRCPKTQGLSNHLFAYPAQSNFSGTKYPLDWIQGVHRHGLGCHGNWYVLLDAASYVTTSPLDLSVHCPDFVVLSFYKLLGFPTGLGALLVRNSSESVLTKTFFGGGTVKVSMATKRFHVSHDDISSRFEDGTVAFLDIVALHHGLDTLQSLTGGMDVVRDHTFLLAKYIYDHLRELRHHNRAPVVRLYHSTSFEEPSTQGPIINFNVVQNNGNFVGFAEVDKLAQLYNIHLRTGCFCNMGACQRHLQLSHEQVLRHFQAGHVCGDQHDLVEGVPTGSVRVSLGYMSTWQDVRLFLDFIKSCFVSLMPVTQNSSDTSAICTPQDINSSPSSPLLTCTTQDMNSLSSDVSVTCTKQDIDLSPSDASVTHTSQDINTSLSNASVTHTPQDVSSSPSNALVTCATQSINSSLSNASGRCTTQDIKSSLSNTSATCSTQAMYMSLFDDRVGKYIGERSSSLPSTNFGGDSNVRDTVITLNKHDRTSDDGVDTQIGCGVTAKTSHDINGVTEGTSITLDCSDVTKERDVTCDRVKTYVTCDGNDTVTKDATCDNRDGVTREGDITGEEGSTVQPTETAADTLAIPPTQRTPRLTHIFLYPVKSCASFEVSQWPLGSRGLLYDRHWMVLNRAGVSLSQKRAPRLCLIQPFIDLDRQVLHLSQPGHGSVEVPLQQSGDSLVEGRMCHTKVCGDRVTTLDCGSAAAQWLSTVLDMPGCRLVQQSDDEQRCHKGGRLTRSGHALSLANEAQYVLIASASLTEIQGHVSETHLVGTNGTIHIGVDSLMRRFRPNLVVSTQTAFEEDSWKELTVGRHTFLNVGLCSRCQMVCVDQRTAQRSQEPLKALSALRGSKVLFGIHLQYKGQTDSNKPLQVGDYIAIHPNNQDS